MNNERLFPPELLSESSQVRLKYFNDVIVDHPTRDEAMADLDEKVNGLLDQRLILLLGAAGVGKTELLKSFIQQLITRRRNLILEDRQRVPGFFVELEAPVRGSFDFSPFYRESLALINCVLPGSTLSMINRLAGKSDLRTLNIEAAGRKPSAEALKERFTETLTDRLVEICGVDEAINAFKTSLSATETNRERFITDQADRIKSQVNKSQTTFVLIGAFDFYHLTIGTAQLARRSLIVHLRPYSSVKSDLVGFLIALKRLLAYLPINHSITPEEHSMELFLQSLGCVGNLKNILKSALNKALKRGMTLNIDLVRKSYFPAPSLLKMKADLEKGVAGLDRFLSLDELAGDLSSNELDRAEREKPRQRSNLKPGETTPSHRREATELWKK